MFPADFFLLSFSSKFVFSPWLLSVSPWFMSSRCLMVCARGIQGRGATQRVARVLCAVGAGLSRARCDRHAWCGTTRPRQRRGLSPCAKGCRQRCPGQSYGGAMAGLARAMARWPDLNAVGRGGSPQAW
jgi:hypothetical protein